MGPAVPFGRPAKSRGNCFACHDHRRCEPYRKPRLRSRRRQLLHLMVHSVYSDRDVFLRELISNAADACEKLRYEAIERPELLGDDAEAAHHHPRRCGQQAPHRRGQRHRHGPRRDGRGAGHHRALRHARLPGKDRGRQGATARRSSASSASASIRPSWSPTASTSSRARRAATRPGSGRPTARANIRSAPVAGDGCAEARHPRRAAPDGRREILHRALHAGAAGQAAVRPCAGADLDRREAGRGGEGSRRRHGAVDQVEGRDQARGIQGFLPERRRAV